ncbi:MAG: GldG family protein [Gemmatimonadota bacterium]|nr:GldG family protein [Gemmatimonadota bacterium]
MFSKRIGFETGLVVGAVLLLGIAVFLNRTVSNLALGRFDLTENQIYTVSEGAKNILGRLEVPVQVKYFVTPAEEMPAGLTTLQQDVRDKLQELAITSGGNLEFQLVNPKETPELEEDLAAKGIRPFQVQSVDRDALALKLVYSALSIGYKDKAEEILPQVLPETLANLEYEILTAIVRTTRDMDPVIAVYSTRERPDPQLMQMYMQMGQAPPEPPDNFTAAREVLTGNGYDVRPVDLTEASPIPEEAATLLLLGVQELGERQRYEIAQFLRHGGRVILSAQALLYDYAPGSRGGFSISARAQASSANDLLSEYGVRVDDRILMDAQMATLAIPRTTNLGGLRFQVTEPVQAPMQIRVLGDGLSDDLPLTAGVPELLYLWGTRVTLDEEAQNAMELSSTTVLSGSAESWLLNRSAGLIEPADVNPTGHEPVPSPPLAVLVEGTFPDPWAEKPVPEWPEGAAAEDEAPEEVEPAGAELPPAPGKLLVTGCAKMFENMLLEQSAHALFLLNSVDALTLGEDLISIRAKRFDRRTFGEVSDGKKLAFRMINVALIPILAVAFALTRRTMRRRQSDEYAARYAASHGGS